MNTAPTESRIDPPPAPAVYSLRECAAVLGIHECTVRRLVRAGRLHAVRLGARRVVPVEFVNSLLRRGTIETRG